MVFFEIIKPYNAGVTICGYHICSPLLFMAEIRSMQRFVSIDRFPLIWYGLILKQMILLK